MRLTPEQQQLVLSVLPACHRFARQIAGPGESPRAAAGELYLAACKAALAYDPARGAKFLTVAIWSLRSAVDHLRSKDQTMKRTGVVLPLDALHPDALSGVARARRERRIHPGDAARRILERMSWKASQVRNRNGKIYANRATPGWCVEARRVADSLDIGPEDCL